MPGLYQLIPVTASGKAAGPAIPLTITAPATTPTPLVYVASELTWQAYNMWGGRSLYGNGSKNATERYQKRARQVSLKRPLITGGYYHYQTLDASVPSWLEKLGIDTNYTTDVYLDARPSVLSRTQGIVFGGHSEYWTARMYDATLARVAQGTNVFFLGANNIWWQTRLEGGGTTMVVYRESQEDPVATTNPTNATILWADGRVGRPGSALTGAGHSAIHVHTGGLMLNNPPDWLTQGTALKHGSILSDAVGGEADAYLSNVPRPRSAQVVAVGLLEGSAGPKPVSMLYVTNPQGAGIMTTGSMDWPCEISPRCSEARAPADSRADMLAITNNIIRDFAQPTAGQRHPITGSAPDIKELTAQLPPGAMGTYGPGKRDD